MTKRKPPFNVIVPSVLLALLFVVLIIIAYPPAVTARYYLYHAFLILLSLAISYVLITLLYAFYDINVRNKFFLKKSQSLFSTLIPANNVSLRIIYDDHSTKFIEASYTKALTEDEVSRINNNLHACEALHPNEGVWHGDWEDFCTRNLSSEIMLKFYDRSTKKPIDEKKVVFFIGASRDAVKRFYRHLVSVAAKSPNGSISVT